MPRPLLISALVWLLLALSARAADIAGNDGYLPLQEGAAKYGINQATVDALLDRGGEISCITLDAATGKKRIQSMVGWVLGSDVERIITNAHVMTDDDGQPKSGSALKDCYFALNRDVYIFDTPFKEPSLQTLTAGK